MTKRSTSKTSLRQNFKKFFEYLGCGLATSSPQAHIPAHQRPSGKNRPLPPLPIDCACKDRRVSDARPDLASASAHLGRASVTYTIDSYRNSSGSSIRTTTTSSSSSRRARSLARAAVTMSNQPFNRAVLVEVFERLDRALGHIPYAICGLAAMHAWGFTSRSPSRVSVVCPAHSRGVVRSWAVANGAILDPSFPGLIGIRTADGVIRKVRIKYANSASFNSLRIVRRAVGVERRREVRALAEGYGGAAATPKVLALSCMLDQCALAYTENPRSDGNLGLLRDAMWILKRIVDGVETPHRRRGSGAVERLTRENVPHVVDPLFWGAFSLLHEGSSTSLLRRAGLILPVESFECENQDRELI